MKHYHVWDRQGDSLVRLARIFRTRPAAWQWVIRQRANHRALLYGTRVLECREDCEATPSPTV